MKRLFAISLLTLMMLQNVTAETRTGPTVLLGYDEATHHINRIETFMYFIPLTSPVRIGLEKSPENDQRVWISGYELRDRDGRFTVRCDFEMRGKGFYSNKFDDKEIIAYNTSFPDHPTTTTNLDYMRFEGDGSGTIEIRGLFDGWNPVVESVSIHFDNRGVRSPVFVEMYSLDPVEGVYLYENRHNLIKARISTLTFYDTPGDEQAKMRLKVARVGNAESPDGFLSSIKAAIVNIFVDPIDVNNEGNSVVLAFGKALAQKEDRFAFPFAENLSLE